MKFLACVLASCVASVAPFVALCDKPSHCQPDTCRVKPCGGGDDLDQLKGQVIDPYVEVRAGEGIGSGTVIEFNGEVLVLTAAHVVGCCVKDTKASVQDKDAKDVGQVERHYEPVTIRRISPLRQLDVQADIVLFSPVEESGGHDLALLKPRSTEGLKATRFSASAKMRPGQDAWYIGTPIGLHRSLEKSIINQTDMAWHGNIFTVTNGNGTFGNSGGGLFVRDDRGFCLVGVVVRKAHGGDNSPLMCQTQKTILAFLTKYKP